MKEIVGIISEYLSSHRRLTVAGLGTFITREGGEILFSEFVKGDDGVLRSLMVARGVSELESPKVIEEFVAWVMSEVERSGGRYHLDGLCLIEVNATPLYTPQTPKSQPTIKVEEPTEAAEVAEVHAPKRGLDFWTIFTAIMILIAVVIFVYSFILSWRTGGIELPEQLDAVMESIFGGDITPPADLAE